MKKKIILAAALSLVAVPVVNALPTIRTVEAIQQGQQQSGQMVALGGSLNAQQAQQTLQLLGAGTVDPANLIYVDGTMINRYLNDGSGPGTIVYSSALIQPMQEGYGVQVQIMTPQNILSVSATTYQNAAITAGARNANLRIAAASPVTGEGALTGVYALLESQGVQVSQQDVQVAQREIKVVQEINENPQVQISDQQVNQIIAEIKQEIVQANVGDTQNVDQTNSVENDTNVANDTNITGDGNTVENSTNIDNSTEINNIVNNVTNNYGITDPETVALLQEYAQSFSATEAANSVETATMLEQSITEYSDPGPWYNVLQGLEAVPADQLLAQERADYSDSELFHDFMPELQDELYKRIQSGEFVFDLYADTFIFEFMQPNMTNADKTALSEMRTIMYQYTANWDGEWLQTDPIVQPTKQAWSDAILAFDNTEGPLKEMHTRMAIATGRAPQVYTYANPKQDGSVVSFENFFSHPAGHTSDMMLIDFDLANDSISLADGGFLGFGSGLPSPDYLNDKYRAEITNERVPMDIPADYVVPGQVIEEESTETTETSLEESQVNPVEETTVPEVSQEITVEPVLPTDPQGSGDDPVTQPPVVEPTPDPGVDPVTDPAAGDDTGDGSVGDGGQ